MIFINKEAFWSTLVYLRPTYTLIGVKNSVNFANLAVPQHSVVLLKNILYLFSCIKKTFATANWAPPYLLLYFKDICQKNPTSEVSLRTHLFK